MANAPALTKSDHVRAAFADLVREQIKARDIERSSRTQKALSLLHVPDAEMTDDVYLAQLYDSIVASSKAVK